MGYEIDIIPGLPNDVALECLIRIPFQALPTATHTSTAWKAEIEHPQFYPRRRSTLSTRPLIVVSQAWSDPTSNRMNSPFYRLVLCDPGTGEWSDLPPIPYLPEGLPILCQVVGVGSELVLLGGCDPVSWRVLDSVFIYNFASAAWRRGARMPGEQRLFFGCATDSDRTVYVAGGHNEEKSAARTAMAYDVAEDEWARMPDMSIPRDECAGIFHGGKFRVVGGYTTDIQGEFRGDAEAFDVATRCWDPVDENFVEDATCSTNCVSSHDGMIYMCRKGNVMAREGSTWRVLAGIPSEIHDVDYVASLPGKLVVIGCSKFEEPHRAYTMDLSSYKWSRIEAPKDCLGHVQSGCYLEI